MRPWHAIVALSAALGAVVGAAVASYAVSILLALRGWK